MKESSVSVGKGREGDIKSPFINYNSSIEKSVTLYLCVLNCYIVTKTTVDFLNS